MREGPLSRSRILHGIYVLWYIGTMINESQLLIERVQTGMGSRSYTPGPLGRTEVSLRSFAHRMRELIPESRLDRSPGAGWHVRPDTRKK